MLLQKIRNSKTAKVVSVCIAINMLSFIASPNQAFALTSGPTTPEVQSFEPITTNQMVDPFTGDFTYNIPLFNLPGPDGGYPFNLAYHAGIGMEQEASWVGLGWNINAGALNRQVNNLPDEFNGTDKITLKQDMKRNVTVGVGVSKGAEIWGVGSKNLLSPGFTLAWNNYRGFSSSGTVGYGSQFSNGLELGLGLSLSSEDGVGMNFSTSYNNLFKTKNWNFGVGGSIGINSRQGLSDIKLDANFNKPNLQIDIQNSAANTSTNGPEPTKYELKKHNYKLASTGSSLSFTDNAFYPAVNIESSGTSLSLNWNAGSDAGGYYDYLGISAFYNVSWMKDKGDEQEIAAYGFNYIHNAGTNEKTITDNAWEKNGIIRKQTPIIGSPRYSPDVYSILGQGVGSMFKAKRNDFGRIQKRTAESGTYGGNFGAEGGVGSQVHLGSNLGFNYSKNYSGNWHDMNDVPYMKYIANSTKTQYRVYGEHSSTPVGGNYPNYILPEDFNQIALNSFLPSHYTLDNDNEQRGHIELQNQLRMGGLDGNQNSTYSITHDARINDHRNANCVLPLSNAEVTIDANTSLSEFNCNYYNILDVNNNGIGYNKSIKHHYKHNDRPDHHHAGYITTTTEGMRYVYGLPVYNNVKKELVYTIESPANGNPSSYTSDQLAFNDNSISRTEDDYRVSNSDKYLSITETPEYAYSYLLTSVLGPDYVDYDDIPGPSEGDLGYWVKFNYVKTNSTYEWKAPYNGQNYLPGKKTSYADDKGSYLYGTKEVYYLATAETKTHIAEFQLSAREDGYGANGPHHDLNELPDANSNSSRSYKLDEINLYLKSERWDSDGNNIKSATPLQTYHFEYDYSLCSNTPNNSGNSSITGNTNKGKLTLKNFYVTYKNNARAALSKYSFDYQNNYSYDVKCVDRWGNYKIHDATNNPDNYNLEHPYADQESTKTDLDKRAAAWCLSKISLPSGSQINIEYESDTYSYVQNQRAMKMIKIKNLGGCTVNATNQTVDIMQSDIEDNRYILFELDSPVSSTSSNETTKYIQVGDQLFFKLYMDLSKGLIKEDKYEYISGYAEVEEVGIYKDLKVNDKYPWGYIKIKKTKRKKEKKIHHHPFLVAAWQYIRNNAAELIGPTPTGNLGQSSHNEKLSFVNSFAKMHAEMSQVLLGGYYNRMAAFNYANRIDLKNSFIRVNCPDGTKYGGGHRVKSLILNDNWHSDAADQAMNEYGQVYNYTIKDGNFGGQEVSSGVAINEPMIGGEANPLRQPYPYIENIPFRTNNNLFFEFPINESLYPAARVGYQKVSVQSLATYRQKLDQNDQDNIQTNSTSGKTIYEFYTAKDFPVQSDFTVLGDNKSRNVYKLMIPLPFFSLNTKRLNVSQGFVSIFNDMHGKLKKVMNIGQKANGEFDENLVVSSTEYIFKTVNKTEHKKSYEVLDNVVDVISHDDLYTKDSQTDYKGVNIQQHLMATEYDYFIDTKEENSLGRSFGLQINTEVMLTPVPIPIPIILPDYSVNKTRLRQAALNKIIHQSGILQKVITYNGKSTREAENVLFDPLTGEALLTVVSNDYNNPVYTYNYPARWEYEGMGAASDMMGKVITLQFEDLDYTTDRSIITNINQTFYNGLQSKFYPGDEYVLKPTDTDVYYRITYLYDDVQSKQFVFVVDPNGITGNTLSNITSASECKMINIRPGKRNHLTAKAMQITALTNPLKHRELVEITGETHYLTVDNVLSINAVSFRDQWINSYNKTNDGASNKNGNAINPYSTGDKGIWSPWRSYAYVGPRTQSASVDLENDGVMNDVPLFQWNSFEFDYGVRANTGNNWKLVSDATQMNANNQVTEERNPESIYSAALFGFDDRLNTALASNATYSEIGFESFEEHTADALKMIDPKNSSNLDFYHQTKTLYAWDNFVITKGDKKVITLDREHQLASGTTKAKITAETYHAYTSSAFDYKAESIFDITDGEKDATDAKKFVLDQNLKLSDGTDVDKYRGNIAFQRKYKYSFTGGDYMSNPQGAFAISNAEAHTGDHSLLVKGNVGFIQNKLRLTPGKSYVVSLWVKPENDGNSTYGPVLSTNDFGINLKFFNKVYSEIPSATVSLGSSHLTGSMIEGWQRIEMEFTMDESAKMMAIEFLHKNDRQVYVDDVKISPQLSHMVANVYSKKDLRLAAQLDANHYATFYYYNEDGSLFLVKRETKDGIVTVSESRAHTKSTTSN